MKIRELFADASKWTQYCLARDLKRGRAEPQSPQAVQWCLLGAIIKCYNPTSKTHSLELEITDRIRDALGVLSISAWNDTHGRTFEEVKALVERIDI